MKKMTIVPMHPHPDFLAPHPATTPRNTLLKTSSSESYDGVWSSIRASRMRALKAHKPVPAWRPL